ncbi:UNVERIFIED_CONTAM: hypothetical protein GTU68_066103 [Idotea baltica]|nr:hypothetical protein [Idotea baltica]
MNDPPATVVQPVSLQTTSSNGEASERTLCIRLGRATYQRQDLAKIDAGSTLVLDCLATEPVDIIADGQLIARGEVLLIEGKYCVRICEVIGQPTLIDQQTIRNNGKVSG